MRPNQAGGGMSTRFGEKNVMASGMSARTKDKRSKRLLLEVYVTKRLPAGTVKVKDRIP